MHLVKLLSCSQSLIFWDLNLINWSLQNHEPENKNVITLFLSDLAKASQAKDGNITLPRDVVMLSEIP